MKTTPRQIIKEIEELEPKNIVDYIFKGSGLSQYVRNHKKALKATKRERR